MGRKPIEDKRVQLNRMVAGATPPLLTALAEQHEMSEGRVIDWAVQVLAIAGSFGVGSIKGSGSVNPNKPKVSRPRFLKRRIG